MIIKNNNIYLELAYLLELLISRKNFKRLIG